MNGCKILRRCLFNYQFVLIDFLKNLFSIPIFCKGIEVLYFFCKNNLCSFLLKIKNKFRTIPAAAEQSLKFSIYEQIFTVNIVYKIAASVCAISKLHFALCLFRYICGSQPRNPNKQKVLQLI